MSPNAVRIPFTYPRNEKNPTGKPLPTQKRFHQSQAKYRLLAGGFGTGKTTSLVMEVIKDMAIPNNYGVLGRKDLGELKSTTLKELLDIVPEETIRFHNKQDKVIEFVNGSQLYYMNLDASREAVEKIKSLNLGFVAIDQLEEITEDVFLAFQGRLRRHNTRRRFYATCNPAGHDWLFHRWKVNDMLKHGETVIYKDAKYDPSYELFEAYTSENIYLPDDYIQELLKYPKQWLARFFYCSWDDYEGLVYSEFKEALHVVDYYEPLVTDSHTHVMDYGFTNPTCILYASTDYDGVTTIYDEFYQSKSLIADTSAEYKKNKWWKQAHKIADPSIHKTERDGNNVHNEFVKNGVWWIDADNSVLQGIDKVNTLFKSGKLRVTKNCVNFLSEIGNYKWKQIKVGQERPEYEEPVKKDDHAMDALRYLANYISTPIEPAPRNKTAKRMAVVELQNQTRSGGKTRF